MTYYAQRKSILNGVAQTPNNRYGTEKEMERQFHLYCANACDPTQTEYDVDSIEWGTVEQGVIERKRYLKTPTPEPEPEEEPEEEQ